MLHLLSPLSQDGLFFTLSVVAAAIELRKRARRGQVIEWVEDTSLLRRRPTGEAKRESTTTWFNRLSFCNVICSVICTCWLNEYSDCTLWTIYLSVVERSIAGLRFYMGPLRPVVNMVNAEKRLCGAMSKLMQLFCTQLPIILLLMGGLFMVVIKVLPVSIRIHHPVALPYPQSFYFDNHRNFSVKQYSNTTSPPR